MRRILTGLAAALALGTVGAPALAAQGSGMGDGLRVLFYLQDSLEIASSSQRDLQQAVDQYRRAPGARIELVGHSNCFETGPMALSERRAHIVADALVDMGVDRDAISLRWVGGAEHGAGNALNQRVDIQVVS